MTLKRKRRVRIHLKPGTGPSTVEGVMTGRRPVAGSYVLALPKLVRDEDQTHSFPESVFEIPAANVALVQVLTG